MIGKSVGKAKTLKKYKYIPYVLFSLMMNIKYMGHAEGLT